MSTSSLAASIAALNTYQARVRFYLVKAAVAIVNEDPTTTGHAERVAYAQLVLGGGGDLYEMALATTSDSAVFPDLDITVATCGVADADLENAVNARFSAFAGVATSL